MTSSALAKRDPLAEVAVDAKILQAAKAIQLMYGTDESGVPKISSDLAIVAALYALGTGQIVGQDYYLDARLGKIPGYQGVQKEADQRGVGNYTEVYRNFSDAEIAEHGILPGDVAKVCEITQLDVLAQCRQMGVPYHPVVGFGIVRKKEMFKTFKWEERTRQNGTKYNWKVELPEDQWVPLEKEGGYDFVRIARNRAHKDGLRHTNRAHASVADVLVDAAREGVEVDIPETLHPTVEQAELFVAASKLIAEVERERQKTTAEERAAKRAGVFGAPKGFEGFGDEEEETGKHTDPRQVPVDEPVLVSKLTRPYAPELLKEWVGQAADAEAEADPGTLKDADKKAKNKAWAAVKLLLPQAADADKLLVLEYLCGGPCKTVAWCNAIVGWCDPEQQVETGEWIPDMRSVKEAEAVLELLAVQAMAEVTDAEFHALDAPEVVAGETQDHGVFVLGSGEDKPPAAGEQPNLPLA